MPRIRIAGSRLSVVLLVSWGLSGCGDAAAGPAAPDPGAEELTVRVEGARGVYRMAPGDSVDVPFQEAYYAWLQERLGVPATRPFEYFKYRSRAHMRAVTGRETNGWAERGGYRLHSIWPIDNHEAVHALISGELGLAPPLLNEGAAVAHQTFPHWGIFEARWSGTPLDELAARYRREGRIPALGDLLRGPDFFRHDTGLTYPMAGSFVKSVIERHGYADLRAFFRASAFEDAPDRFRANFRDAFGEELDEAWEVWLARLDG